MGFSVSERVIKLLCGNIAFDKGLAYYQAGRVTVLYADTDEISEPSRYEADVLGESCYNVRAVIDSDGDVRAACTCPDYYQGGPFCTHIAALLITVLDLQNSEKGEGQTASSNAGFSRDQHLVDGMLGMFGTSRPRPSGTGTFVDNREPLSVAWTCKPFTLESGNRMFGIEFKIGLKRSYIVPKIRAFLLSVQRGEAYEFSKQFVYEPSMHSFAKEDNDILQKLIEIVVNEQMYRYSFGANFGSAVPGGERLLPVPPYFWDSLLPALTRAPLTYIQQGDKWVEGIQVTAKKPPVRFQLKSAEYAEAGYHLDVEGLDAMVIMTDYGFIVSDGQLLKLPQEDCRRLAGVQAMLENSRRDGIGIMPEQMESFMDKVVPGLKQIGHVTISDSISKRIIQSPLTARLYLDRLKDRLLAGLEFQYGDIVINPLDEKRQSRENSLILVRDTDKERRILDLMEQDTIVQTEGGYYLSGEDAEYDFLYHTVPLLEPHLDVYATTAVKARFYKGSSPPTATLSWNEKTDWLEFKFDIVGIPESEIQKVLKSLQEKRRYYRLPDGALLPLDTEEFLEIISFMNEVGIHRNEITGKQFSLPLSRGLHLAADAARGDAVTIGKSLRRLLDNMQDPGRLDFPVPDSLAPVLRDYQEYGFQWMKTLANYRFGGILADDMGLGKTMQSIAFLLSELPAIRKDGVPALIVAPASVVYNWLNELHKFTPEIKAVIADGSAADRGKILQNAARADIIITSYPLLRRDIAIYAKKLFHTLILDEAQTIKNHVTQTAQSVKLLQARYRFALTGTPVENALEDIWSIYGVVFPNLLPGKKEFHDLPRETVARKIRPFLLRRLKRDVLKELPDKIESLQASELLPEQKKLYVAYLARLKKEALRHLNSEDAGSNRIKILAGLTRLRQLCCHPSLFVEGYTGSSAKMEQLLEIIEECRSAGKRMLVFSQFTGMLELIGQELTLQDIPYFYLDGQTPAPKRVELCNQFNAGERDLFLISLKAGGTGLNLTGADTVILYDLWWNPAVEQQAADRAHRIGQKNVVQVIRLVTRGTVEDKMFELQQKKINLIDEVIQPGQEALSSLTEQDIREILGI
ncbi:SNF2 helicase associated domain-containing protein [Paenibacillus sp. sgz500958]|uniref:DEAD/DEAH box helicase n=1 Tax=Paenibacillus sp. sgz500958 TaxID=3242475 RepID=UPI0036D37C6B